MVRVFAAYLREEHEDEEQLWPPMIAGFKEVAAYGYEKGILVGLQNHNHNNVTRTGTDLLRALRETDHPYFTHIVDTGQYAGSPGASGHRGSAHPNYDCYDSIAQTAPYAVYARTKFYQIDSGVEEWLDYPRILDILRGIGYNGCLSVVYEGGIDAESFELSSINYVKCQMNQIVDLTMPIENHFRWAVERELKEDFNTGSAFQVTWVGWAVHGFTHIDAPRHIDPNGQTTSDIPLNQIVGRAAIVDLTGIEPNSAITEIQVRDAGEHINPGDIVVLKTCWDEVASPKTPEFWTTAPYMTRPACEWLLSRQIKAVGYDFPQDYPIRKLLDKEVAPISDFVTHDVLLRNGVIMIEYLCNLRQLTTPYTQLYALPLKILESDGAPARVIAFQPEA